MRQSKNRYDKNRQFECFPLENVSRIRFLLHIRTLMIFVIVFSVFISCEELINEEDISKDSVQLLAPTNNSTIDEGDIGFNWKALSGADDYKLQVATPNFTSAIQVVLDTTISKNSFTSTLIAGEYEWRVKALNSAYETEFTTHALIVNEVVTEEGTQK